MAQQTKRPDNNRRPTQNAIEKGGAAVVVNVHDFAVQIGKWDRYIQGLVPPGIKAENVIRQATTAYRMNSDLQQCTFFSVINSVCIGARLGLELNTPLGHGYLIRYKDQCTFQAGYRGLLTLGYRSEKIHTAEAHVVYNNDKFDFQYGDSKKLTHKPELKGKRDPDDWYAVYLQVIMRQAGPHYFHVMRKDDILRIRDSSSKGAFDDQGNLKGPWLNHPDEMYKKTCAKQGLKFLDLSASLSWLIGVEDGLDGTGRQERVIEWDDFERVGKDARTVPVNGTKETPKPEDAAQPAATDAPPVANHPPPSTAEHPTTSAFTTEQMEYFAGLDPDEAAELKKALHPDAIGPFSSGNFWQEEYDTLLANFKLATQKNPAMKLATKAQADALLGRWKESKADLIKYAAAVARGERG